MADANPPVVRNGRLAVVMAPGLGLDLNMDYLRKNLVDGEPWWE
jgi:L-alanine-DL-glutamate epimerase-like enolase superfamily enzyme